MAHNFVKVASTKHIISSQDKYEKQLETNFHTEIIHLDFWDEKDLLGTLNVILLLKQALYYINAITPYTLTQFCMPSQL